MEQGEVLESADKGETATEQGPGCVWEHVEEGANGAESNIAGRQ